MPAAPPTTAITPLPDAVGTDLPPPLAAVEVVPAASRYPDAATAGQPFHIAVRAIAPEGTPPLRGAVRWRRAFAPRWEESPLQPTTDDRFSGAWTPPEPGDYEWCVELWTATGKDPDRDRPGSSGSEELHLLRASRGDLDGAGWHRPERLPFFTLRTLLPANADGAAVFLMPPPFPIDPETGLPGCDGAGHYSLDPALGDTRDFGELAAAARAAGFTLGLELPLACSPGHPMRTSHPERFAADGTPLLGGPDWRELWPAWEAVFRFWLVQGIEVFHIPDPARAPLAFWEALVGSILEHFPHTLFTADAADLAALAPHLAGVGFTPSGHESAMAAVEIDTSNLEPVAPFLADADDGLDDARGHPVAPAHPDPGGGDPPAPLFDDSSPPAPFLAAGAERDLADLADPAPAAGVTLPSSSSDPGMGTELQRRPDGDLILRVTHRNPGRPCRAHIHLDLAAMGIGERSGFHLHDLATGRTFHWNGSTNFLSLGADETEKTFRIERG